MLETLNHPKTTRQTLGIVALWSAVSLLLGLIEVGFQFSRLPIWFYGYTVLAGVFVTLGQRIISLNRPGLAYWQRALLQGGGWWVAVSVLLFGEKLLSGKASDFISVASYFGVWLIGAFFFGLFAAGLDKFKTSQHN